MIRVLTLIVVLLPPAVLYGQDTVLEDLSERSGRDISEDLEDLRTDRLDLNAAGREDLLRIPWIDDRLARSIVACRTRRGGFGSLEELLDVDGVTPDLYEKIAPFLAVDARLEGVARIDSRYRRESGDRRIRAALSRGWFSTGLRAARGYGGGAVTATGYLSVAPPVLRGIRVTAGGMYLRLGQGLLSWPSFGAQRYSGRPVVYPLGQGGIRGTTSADADRVVRGAGASWEGRTWSIGLLHGRRGEPARRTGVTALSLGLRLPARIEAGGNILRVGDSPILSSVTVRFGTDRLLLFAEAAGCGLDGAAGLVGLKKQAGDCSLLLLYRREAGGFHSELGFDMSSPRSGTGNLTAMYTALVVRAGRGRALMVYADTGRREAVAGREGVERFQEFSLLGRLAPFRSSSSSLMLVAERTVDETYPGSRERRTKVRWDTSFRPVPGLELGMRWYLVAGMSDRSWRASLVSLRIRDKDILGFDAGASASLYHSTEGGSLYLVEGGLPGRSLFLRLSGDGERYTVVVRRKLAGRWTVRWKLAEASRFETQEQGGFELGFRRRELVQEFQLELEL